MAPPQHQQKANYASLPRSITWRLRLGLLKSPAETVDPTISDVFRHNAGLLREQQGQYEKLQASYGDHLTQADAQQNEEEEDDDEAVEDEELESIPQSEDLDPLSAGLAALDPLTAMLQEQQAQEDKRQQLDLRYRKERARRKRGIATEAKVVIADCDQEEGTKKLDSDTLDVVDKDLNRLPTPDISDFEGVSVQWETDEQRAAWIEALREVLYIYGQEHPHIGYRQGMHEVASYLWMTLEMDRKVFLGKATIETTEMQIQLHEQSTLLFGRAAAYYLLRSILGNVRQAFDVKVASNSRPLEDMSHSILAKIKQQHNYHGIQDRLTPMLLSLSVPPQLYCTKWIRLLFSREVVGDQNVIALWDVFIELVSEGWEWMAVLETTAASRILLVRDQLLDVSMPDYSPAAHHHHAMDLLMNMPPMNNIESLVGRLKALLELQKYTQCMHQEVAQQDEANHNNPLMQNNNARQQLHHQQYNQNDGGFPSFGDDISAVFSLKSLRQSLEQGAQQLSSSSDTLKKRLVDEWNVLKQPPPPQQDFQHTMSSSPSQRSYMMDAALFADEDGLQPQQPAPHGYPRPVTAHSHSAMTSQQPRQQRQQGQAQQQYSRPAESPTFGGPVNTAANPLIGPANGTTPTAVHTANHTNTVPPVEVTDQLPQELAYRLGNSAAVLQEFVMSVARPPSQPQYPTMLAFQNGDAGSTAKVPNTVWEALAEVEAVRNVLLQQPSQNRFK